MCLLVDQVKGTVFEDAWLEDFYHYNADGVGVMWGENGVIHVTKHLPVDKADLIKFFRDHIDGKQCAWHLRMRTHGDTDLANCHPYKVFGQEDGYPIYLMHNGVLHTGNKNDVTKSDTWHFINDIIKPALKADPKQFMEPWFKTLIEDYIGHNNKFVMMDAYGNSVTFNYSSGVEWRDCWFSNTYAWSADQTGAFPKKIQYGLGGYGGWGGYDDDWRGYGNDWKNTSTTPKSNVTNINGKTAIGGNVAEDEVEDAPDDAEMVSDAYDYAEMFFENMQYMAMDTAYREVEFDEVVNYYLDSPESAMLFLTNLEGGYISEQEVLHKFDVTHALTDDHLKVGMQ